jgi:PPOX class probable F420-dependent enzyme
VELNPRLRALFDGPNFAHVATLMPDGSPHSAPIWISREGDRLMFLKEPGTRGLKNLRRDPRLAISICSVEDPYLEAHVRGRVVEFHEGPETTELVHRQAVEYTGEPYPGGDQLELVLLVVELERGGSARIGDFEHKPPGAALHLSRVADPGVE